MKIEFTEQQKKAFKSEFGKGFTDEQFEVCLTFCQIRGLLPGKHVVFQLRKAKEWDEIAGARVEVTKIIFITTIDASRLIAQRTGQYGGQAPEEYIYLDDNGSPSLVSQIPLPQLPLPPKGTAALPREPWAVRTTVFRKDFPQPISSVARFDAYASTYRTQDGVRLSEMWQKRGPEQLAKCSEMLSLRRAFPEELGGLYIAEEFKSEEEVQPTTATAPASVAPVPVAAPAVNQAPAEATDKPRPGEKVTVEYHADSVPATLPKHSGETLKVVPKEEPVKPTKKKGKAKKAEPAPPETQQLTEEDIAAAQTPLPEADKSVDQKAAKEFVEAVTSFTEEEAKNAGLPAPEDPIPTKEQRDGFVARMRALSGPGVDITSLGDYTLALSDKTSSKYMTVGDWTKTLNNLEAAKEQGTLRELVKSLKPKEKEF